MVTVLFLTKLNDYFKSRVDDLIKEFPNDRFVIPQNRAEGEEFLKVAEIIVSGSLTSEQIERGEKLRCIIVPWAGVNELPFETIRKRGIIVSNNHGNGKIVAERAVALALSVMGRIVEYHNDLSKGVWHGFEVGSKSEDFWYSLQGKRVSILGLGTIGRHIAHLLSVFDCEIMGYKRNVEQVDGIRYITNNIDEAIAFGKVIFVALPLTKETKGIINRERIEAMSGKFLINVGRGTLIDEEALYYGLKNHILAGAGIDTWYLYPREYDVQLPSKYPIHTFPNVVISPHVGGFTVEGLVGRIDETIENIRHALVTGRPKTVVDLENEY